MDFSQNNQTKEMAYDLRQIYAKLVGDHMVDIAECRKANSFYNWFKALQDLHTIVHHKFKDKENIEKKYTNLITTATNVANQHVATWQGTNFNPQEISKIDRALRDIEEFLYEQMEEAKIFGEGGKQSHF
ncbi:MAG: hypothetical protein QME12_08700 [Nanoarchaeota archaeon]|nr:hypothetical protein [Nanoarchaeota archaeon]